MAGISACRRQAIERGARAELPNGSQIRYRKQANLIAKISYCLGSFFPNMTTSWGLEVRDLSVG